MTTRLPYEKTKEENAVEVLFAERFKSLKHHPMDDETSQIMISLMFATINEDDKEANEQFLVKIITARMKALGYTMDIKAKVFIAFIANSPGMCVMYCHYLAYHCKKNKIQHLTFNEMCENVFPYGFPSEEDLHELWDEQKVMRNESQPGTDNLLDYFLASKSIMAETDI